MTEPLKICTMKVLETIPSNKKLQVAMVKAKMWKPGSELVVQFLTDPGIVPENNNGCNSPSGICWTPVKYLETKTSDIDPLSYTVESMHAIDAVKKVITERIMPMVKNIKIRFAEHGEVGNIRISFDPTGGAWSYVGTDCLGQHGPTMNLGWLDVGTIMHEFCHTLGMIHEHQNPKGNTIKWNKEALYKYFGGPPNNWSKEMIDTQIILPADINTLNGTSFDPQSIMLYFYPPAVTLDGKGTSCNQILSETDKKFISGIYGGTSDFGPVSGFGSSILGPKGSKRRYLMLAVITFLIMFILYMIYKKYKR